MAYGLVPFDSYTGDGRLDMWHAWESSKHMQGLSKNK